MIRLRAMGLLTYRMASDFFGRRPDGRPVVSVFALRRAVASRSLRSLRPGYRTVLFRVVDLDRWAERQAVESRR